MNELLSIADIQERVIAGETDWPQYGDVNVKSNGRELLIFNYTQAATFAGRWNFFERVSRGLILNAHTGEVVARPFDKFFNYGEGGRTSTAPIASVTEKLDGSLGISYIEDGVVKIATRGSFDGDQALWATNFLHENYGPYDWIVGFENNTFLFEIVYPEDRKVVDYSGRRALHLIGVRGRVSGFDYSWNSVMDFVKRYAHFSVPMTYGFDDIDTIVEAAKTLDGNEEGWVIRFTDGQRFKVKGWRYLELAKLISSLTYKNVLEAVIHNTIEQVLESVPDEFLAETRQWIAEIQASVTSIRAEVQAVFECAPKVMRKDFALYAQANAKHLLPYLFAMLDGRDIEPIIYKQLERDRGEA